MTEELENKPNLTITRTKEQELRIYFFIGQRKLFDVLTLPPPVEKTIIYIWEFELEKAFEKAKIKATTQGGYDLTFTGQALTLREFLMEYQTIALQLLAELRPPEEKQEEPASGFTLTPRQMSFEQFKSSIIMAAVEFVDGQDREDLKRIISNLKYEKLNL